MNQSSTPINTGESPYSTCNWCLHLHFAHPRNFACATGVSHTSTSRNRGWPTRCACWMREGCGSTDSASSGWARNGKEGCGFEIGVYIPDTKMALWNNTTSGVISKRGHAHVASWNLSWCQGTGNLCMWFEVLFGGGWLKGKPEGKPAVAAVTHLAKSADFLVKEVD